MKIIIVGAGKVGSMMAAELRREGHDIVIIDKSPAVIGNIRDELDVAAVVGNGMVQDVQAEAEVDTSDLLIATTQNDETNLLCCVVAKRLGCKHTVARIRNPEYDHQNDFWQKNLGISLIINPEKTAAREISRMLQLPSFLRRESFAGGRISLVEFKLPENSVFDNKSLEEISGIIQAKALICTVDRDGEIIIPSGKSVLKAGDKITATASSAELAKLIGAIGLEKKRIKDVMMIGGGRLAVYLADFLIAAHIDVKIIEENSDRCLHLSERLPKATIINGDGTDQKLLLDEGIESVDAVVTLTGIDEENLLVSMFANSLNVPKTITKINRVEYSNVLAGVGVDTIVSPKVLTSDVIIRYVRAVGATGSGSMHLAERNGTLETLYRIVDGKAEALGFTVPADAKYAGKTLAELEFKPSIIVAGIIHNGNVIIPKGSDVMSPGDSVVIITAGKTLSSLSEILN